MPAPLSPGAHVRDQETPNHESTLEAHAVHTVWRCRISIDRIIFLHTRGREGRRTNGDVAVTALQDLVHALLTQGSMGKVAFE